MPPGCVAASDGNAESAVLQSRWTMRWARRTTSLPAGSRRPSKRPAPQRPRRTDPVVKERISCETTSEGSPTMACAPMASHNPGGLGARGTNEKNVLERLRTFMREFVYPNESVYAAQLSSAPSRWSVPPIVEELKDRAKSQGLWNLFLPDREYGAGLTNREYAPLCETMGTSAIAPEIFNCNAPDTGNMEVLAKYGSAAQKER